MAGRDERLIPAGLELPPPAQLQAQLAAAASPALPTNNHKASLPDAPYELKGAHVSR